MPKCLKGERPGDIKRVREKEKRTKCNGELKAARIGLNVVILLNAIS